MRTRILIAVGAWLLGAVAATGGSLLAVSQLGQGIVDSTGQQLTVSAVDSALAREKTERSEAPSPSPSPSPRPPRTVRPARVAHVTPAAQASPTPPPGTLLGSAGGTVLATCQAAGAYLLSWSPQQGFEAQNVVRGPAAIASVQFDTQSYGVTMRVTCRAGVPTVLQSGSGGGGGGDE